MDSLEERKRRMIVDEKIKNLIDSMDKICLHVFRDYIDVIKLDRFLLDRYNDLYARVDNLKRHSVLSSKDQRFLEFLMAADIISNYSSLISADKYTADDVELQNLASIARANLANFTEELIELRKI